MVRTEVEPGCVNWIADRNVPGKLAPEVGTEGQGNKNCLTVGIFVAKHVKYPRQYRLSVANTKRVKKWRQRRLDGIEIAPESMTNFLAGRDPRIPSHARARGLSIASQPGRVTEVDAGAFVVVVDTSRKKILVTANGEAWTCGCDFAADIPDGRCEHVWAVVFTQKKPRPGEVLIEVVGTLDDRSDSSRSYTEGQKATGRLLPEFLRALLSRIDEPPRPEGKAGRSRIPLR